MLFEDNIPYATIKILLIVMGTLGMMCSTTKFKYKPKRIILIFLLYLTYVAVSTAAIIILFGYTFFLRIFLLTISAPAIYLTFRLAGEQPSKAVFNYAIQILVSLYLGAGITLVITKINGSTLTDFLLRLTVFCIVILLEYRFLRRPFLQLSAFVKSGWHCRSDYYLHHALPSRTESISMPISTPLATISFARVSFITGTESLGIL